MKFIKIYGLQRSGTNYLEWLLRNNIDAHVFLDGNVTGWKHGTPPVEIDWAGNNWDNFPVKVEIIERYMETIKPLQSLVQEAFDKDEIIYLICVRSPYSWLYKQPDKERVNLWNVKNRMWYKFSESKKHCKIIKHESLVENYQLVLDFIASDFELGKFLPYRNMTKIIMSRLSVSDKEFDRSFYTEKRYLSHLTSEDKAMIQETADKELMEVFGYA